MLQRTILLMLIVILLAANTILFLITPKLSPFLQTHYKPLSRSRIQHFHQSQYGGFVLATSYYDEMTSATRRLFRLQGWAAKFNITVVEPFILRSTFGLSEDAARKNSGSNKNFARFSEMLSLNDWNTFMKSKYSNARMVLWDDFLYNAPRSIVYIVTKFPKTASPLSAIVQVKNCPDEISSLKYLTVYNFTVLNAWCIDLPPNIRVSMDKFTSSALKDLSISKVTIVFSMWKGNAFYPTNTASLSTYKLQSLNHNEMAKAVSYSPGIMKSTKTYIKKYVGNKRYIAVMVRTQKALMERSELGLPMNALESIGHCIQRIIAKWNKMKQREKINATFLAMDVGEFGSKRFIKTFIQQLGMDAPIHNLVTTLLGNDTTLESWEQSFVDVSPVLTPGIIAMVQKIIAAQSTCLILAGGGSFHVSTEGLYIQKHQHDQHVCLEKVPHCAI